MRWPTVLWSSWTLGDRVGESMLTKTLRPVCCLRVKVLLLARCLVVKNITAKKLCASPSDNPMLWWKHRQTRLGVEKKFAVVD
jgi:hypothetical protein